MPRRRLGSRGYPKSTQNDSQCQWNTLEPVVAISIVSLSPSPIWQDQDVEKSRALFTNEINNEDEGIGPKMRSKMRQRDWCSESKVIKINYLSNFHLHLQLHLQFQLSPNFPTTHTCPLYSDKCVTVQGVAKQTNQERKWFLKRDKSGASFFYQKDSFFSEALDILGPQ